MVVVQSPICKANAFSLSKSPNPKIMVSSLLRLPLPFSPPPIRNRLQKTSFIIKARDRSKNRKPIQRGRYLSIEAIQAVQTLKRAKTNGTNSIQFVMNRKVQRLVKRDMMAVLKELANQGEGMLAFQVFEEVRNEHWYKPQLSVYEEMIRVLANNGLLEMVEQTCLYLKRERLDPDTEGFNYLFATLLGFGLSHIAMDCFRLMKLWESEPDESTFRILINGLKFNGEVDLSNDVRNEAEKYFDGDLGFLTEGEYDEASLIEV